MRLDRFAQPEQQRPSNQEHGHHRRMEKRCRPPPFRYIVHLSVRLLSRQRAGLISAAVS